MILGIGIDAVDISRFTDFHEKPKDQLARLFSPAEIDYCLKTPGKSAEHFAARFAAKEAFLKALSNAYPEKNFALLTICKYAQVNHHANSAPYLGIDWASLKEIPTNTANIRLHLSLTHTTNTATAFVVIEQI